MSNATRIHSEQQADLLQQLEKVQAPIETTSSDSLETLKSHCSLVEGILGLLENDMVDNFTNSFNSAPPQRPLF